MGKGYPKENSKGTRKTRGGRTVYKSQDDAERKYLKEHTRIVSFRFFLDNDETRLNWLAAQTTRIASIRKLIDRQIAETGYEDISGKAEGKE